MMKYKLRDLASPETQQKYGFTFISVYCITYNQQKRTSHVIIFLWKEIIYEEGCDHNKEIKKNIWTCIMLRPAIAVL